MNEPLKAVSEMIGRLLSLDPANLIVVGTLALTYVLRFTFKKFPKEHIALTTMVFTVLVYPILAWKDGQPLRKLITDAIIALVLWVVAVAAHRFIVNPIREKLIAKFGKAGPPGQTEHISKE